jgi:hypothetical protein
VTLRAVEQRTRCRLREAAGERGVDGVQYVAAVRVLGSEALGALLITVSVEACVVGALALLGYALAPRSATPIRVGGGGEPTRRWLRAGSVMYAAMLCYYGPNCFALAAATVRSSNAVTSVVVAAVAVQAALLGLLMAAGRMGAGSVSRWHVDG